MDGAAVGPSDDSSGAAERDDMAGDETAPAASDEAVAATSDAGAVAPTNAAPDMATDAGLVVERPLAPPSGCDVPYTSQIPRLSNEQYANTIRDLLGVTRLTAFDGATPASLLAADQRGTMNQALWGGYRKAAAAVARQVMGNTTQRAAFLGCEVIDAACLHDAISAFGRRAFRRPLSDGEIARFDELLAQGAEITASGSAEELARVLLETFLVSPSFLQRAEVNEGTPADGEHFSRSSHELAARLSYAFWNSMPDPELDAAADAGELATYEQLFAQAQRMLADDKARAMLQSLHRQYLGVRPNSRWLSSTKDSELFPEYTAAAADRAREETELFFEEIVFVERGAFADLFTSGTAFVNQDTALLYDLDPADFGVNLQRVTLDPEQRPGFLTRVGFLASHASPRQTSPVLRGAFIEQALLGINVGVPDPEAANSPVPNQPELDTVRKRLEAQTSGIKCVDCHALLNPPGFVLEAYNAIGRRQSVEADTGAPIDTAAEVHFDLETTVSIDNPAELMAELSVAPGARRQYVRNWVEHAFERPVPSADCVVDHLAANFTSEQALLDLLPNLTLQSEFTWRRQEPSP